MSETNEKQPQILVVDDHDQIRIMLQFELQQWGYGVEVATSAEEALEILQHQSIDLLLTDLHMPGKSGLELASWARQHIPHVAVILMTGEASVESAAQAVRVNAFDYLLKPFADLDLVRASIANALQKRRLQVELELRVEELRVSRASFNSIVDKSTNGILVIDKQHQIRYANPTACQQFSCCTGHHVALLDLIRPGRTVEVEGERLSPEQTGFVEISTEETIWEGQDALLVTLRDITLRKKAELQLVFDAFHDSLTQLPNRALLLDRLENRIRRQQRQFDSMFAVLFIDLDRFKNINDGLGHAMGDVFLVQVAQRLSALLREGDTIARLSGDEFIILLDTIRDVNDAIFVADRILSDFKKPFILDTTEVFTSASIGITTSDISYQLASEVLRDADTAMYHAKDAGKGRYALFTHAMHAQAVNLLRLETDLQLALERGEFFLHYQPIVDLNHKKLFGFEALLRWQHPSRGLLYPSAFVHVAEETGLIVPIGMWVLREACLQLREWQSHVDDIHALKMSVNFSYRQFLQFDIVKKIKEVLAETKLPPRCLKIELTENVLIEHTDLVNSILQELKTLAIQIDIDDFGTGYSSLSYLHRFPIDSLKIDRSFVSRMQDEEKNLEIVRSILGLARSLGIHVVAEGIEHESQLEKLRQLQCDYGQGYLFARPLSNEQALDMLRSTQHWLS